MAETLDNLLRRWRNGDQEARDRAVTLLYSELRRLAAYHFRYEARGHTLQPTALVNEAFVRLLSGTDVAWESRTHFFAVAARQMRRILIDHARRRSALKRADTSMVVSLDENDAPGIVPQIENILIVDEVLQELGQLDPRAAEVVELRVFGGLQEAEIANALNISTATVKRDWVFAKAWLVSRLRASGDRPAS